MPLKISHTNEKCHSCKVIKFSKYFLSLARDKVNVNLILTPLNLTFQRYIYIINKQKNRMERLIKQWKAAYVAQWDLECQVTNHDPRKRKFSTETSESNSAEREIVHKVKPDDTLEGLALKYHVPIEEIKAKNCLSSNEIYFLPELIIPNPQFISLPSHAEQRQDKINKVLQKLYLDPQDEDFAIGLLEQTFWNVENAIKKYHEDIKWQKKYADLLASFQNKKPAAPFFQSAPANTI